MRLLLPILILPCLSLSAADRSPPNIVVLLADDLGYAELGCQGNTDIPTPHIDSMATAGTRFTAAYVTASYCSASRAGLMTGRYQARFGYDFNPIGAKNELPSAGLPASEKTFVRLLHDRGYATGLIGKWHLGGTAAYHPLRRGFDYFFGFTHEGHYFVPPPYPGVTTMLRRRTLPRGATGQWASPDGKLVLTSHMGYDEPAYDANNPIVRNGQPVREDRYLTDAFTDEAIEFIDRNKARPFFLYLAYNAVHSPLQATDANMQRFAHVENIQRRIFAGMLANLDDSVGAVLAKLRSDDLLNNTLVVFLSDNGGPTRELTSSNAPLRGEKGSLYEGGIRVPMLWQWPDRLPHGQVLEDPVISLDIAATALAAAGVGDAEMTARIRDGVNILPQLASESKTRPHDRLFWRMGGKAAIRAGDWKAIKNAKSSGAPWELFNLADDLAEQRDLASALPHVLGELQNSWNAWDREMADPVHW